MRRRKTWEEDLNLIRLRHDFSDGRLQTVVDRRWLWFVLMIIAVMLLVVKIFLDA